MAFLWFFVVLVSILVGYLLTRKRKRLPPGPKGLPILGHLHMLGKEPQKDLCRIAQAYGPIVHMRFGFVPHIIVSSSEAAQLFLKTHDLIFASRPPHQGSKIISWGQSGVLFGAYGPYWRYMRKLFTLELLSSRRVSSFQQMRKEVVGLHVESLREAAQQHIVVDLTAKVSSLAADMSCRMVFGRKYEDNDIHESGFTGVMETGMKLTATPHLGDYFPLLGTLDPQGLTRKMKEIAKIFDDFFEKVIEDHVQRKSKVDIIDTLISLMQSGEADVEFDRRNVKSIMLDLLGASMDTAAATVIWALSELIKNPMVMQKVQTELEQVVGLERMVEESDLDQLEYLYMAVKETFRLHPVVPLLVPHYAMEDSIVNGYDIPNNSQIIINAYAIGRDPNVWTDPEKFIPERFIKSDIDVRGQHFQLIPFGSGRRACPGMQLGLVQVLLVVAQLVHCFNWELPDGIDPENLDMTEEFGLVVYRANHLTALPTYRLRS